MPTNPYDDILSGDNDAERTPLPKPDPEPAAAPRPQALFSEPDPLNDPRFQDDGPEALDAILAELDAFRAKAADFSRLLSELRVIDHKADSSVKRLFLQSDDPHVRGTLLGEKQYHVLQAKKFRMIIEPMRTMAEEHLALATRFNRDVDEHYFSVEKTDREIKSGKTLAMDGIILQRKILGEATDSLQILEGGLKDTERRLKGYVNAGGRNNLSQSEYEMIVRNRSALTSGREHNFEYEFFDVNLLDKTALSLGIFMKETSNQYLKGLGEIFSK